MKRRGFLAMLAALVPAGMFGWAKGSDAISDKTAKVITKAGSRLSTIYVRIRHAVGVCESREAFRIYHLNQDGEFTPTNRIIYVQDGEPGKRAVVFRTNDGPWRIVAVEC